MGSPFQCTAANSVFRPDHLRLVTSPGRTIGLPKSHPAWGRLAPDLPSGLLHVHADTASSRPRGPTALLTYS